MEKYLVYGAGGSIGKVFVEYLKEKNDKEIIISKTRLDNEDSIYEELKEIKPNVVFCFAGRTHGPNNPTIDFLEKKGNLLLNVRDNLYSPVTLALLCEKLGIYMCYMGTGCIFNYDEDHKTDGVNGFKPNDKPNFFGSSYSVVKGFTDRLMHLFPLVLNLRIRMPIFLDPNSRDFIYKISQYKKVINIPNSMTVLSDFLPVVSDLVSSRTTGTVNLCNPGSISHNEVLDLYTELIDPSFTYQNFSVEEQSLILQSERSNNCLDTSFVSSRYNIPHIKDSIRSILLSRSSL